MNNFEVPPEVFESIARQHREKCANCGCSYYEHIDHSHSAGGAMRCPFGDCGDFKAVSATDGAPTPSDVLAARGAHSDGNAHGTARSACEWCGRLAVSLVYVMDGSRDAVCRECKAAFNRGRVYEGARS